MTEAEITCKCLSIRLPDLKRALFKGQTIYLDERVARQSKDLEVARRSGGVQVRYVQRCEEKRQRPTKSPVRVVPQQRRRKAVKSKERTFTAAEVAEMVGQFASPQDVERIIGQRMDGLKGDLQAILTSALTGAGGGVPIASPESVGKVEGHPEETPIFIPEGIVKEGVKAEIDVEEEQSESGGVDAATKALRKAKKTKTKKKAGKKK
jgi:hypothetical protein